MLTRMLYGGFALLVILAIGAATSTRVAIAILALIMLGALVVNADKIEALVQSFGG